MRPGSMLTSSAIFHPDHVQSASIDVHHHILVVVGLIIGSSALLQRGSFDSYGRTASWKRGSIDSCAADGTSRSTPGDTGDTAGRHRSADPGLGIVDNYSAVKPGVNYKTGSHNSTSHQDGSTF